MRLLLLFLLLTICTSGFAQQSAPTNLRTRISDDEQNRSIQIDGRQNGRRIHFDQTFAVTGMSSLRKEVLTYRAFDSVGIAPPLNEMRWLIVTGLGLLTMGIALLMVGFHRVKTAQINPVKSLRSE